MLTSYLDELHSSDNVDFLYRSGVCYEIRVARVGEEMVSAAFIGDEYLDAISIIVIEAPRPGSLAEDVAISNLVKDVRLRLLA